MTKPLEALITDMKVAAELSKVPSTEKHYQKVTATQWAFQQLVSEDNVLGLIAALEQSQKDNGRLRTECDDLANKYENRVPTEWAYNQACKVLQSHKDKIVELESQKLTTSNALLDAGKRIAELEARLAEPVKLPKTNGYWTEQEKAYEEGITFAKRQVRLAGFQCEGDE